MDKCKNIFIYFLHNILEQLMSRQCVTLNECTSKILSFIFAKQQIITFMPMQT